MTLILVISFLLIAFIALLRYDIHKHKHRDASGNKAPESNSSKHDGDKKA
jgi:hypothetical protein